MILEMKDTLRFCDNMWHVMEWSMVSEDGNWADFGEEG
jgi:hypothetical protein